MKKISIIIGFLVILCLCIGFVTYLIEELPTAQTPNSSIHNTTVDAGTFFVGLSGLTTMLVILSAAVILIIVILFFKKLFSK